MDTTIQVANVVSILQNTPRTLDATQMHYHTLNSNSHTIKQSKRLEFLHATACSIGKEKLGFHPLEIGNKSICLGPAIA